MYALRAVVLKRSYSLNSGSTSYEAVTNPARGPFPPVPSRTSAATARSWSGHPDLGPASLQDRIRADGDAVDEALHLREVDAEAFEHVEDRARRLRRGGGDFRVAKRPGRIVEYRRVGEGSAYVHTDAVSTLSIRHASSASASGRNAQLEPQPPAGAGSLPSATSCSS